MVNSPPLENLGNLDGVEIKLNGQRLILPPASLATLKRHGKAIDDFSRMDVAAMMSAGATDTLITVLYEALRRNYPGITAEFIEEHVGIDQINELFAAAMDASGLLRAPKAPSGGEGKPLGESTGTAS